MVRKIGDWQAIITDQDSNLVETYEGQNVALVLKSIFYLGFGSVSRFLSKLGRVFVKNAKITPPDSSSNTIIYISPTEFINSTRWPDLFRI